MTKFIFLITILSLFASKGYSQAKKSIMLIPFNTNMYNNQESGAMIKQSGLSYSQLVQRMQLGLDSCIIAACKDTMRIVSLLNSYTQSASGDLELIHSASDYYLTERLSSKKKKNMFSEKQSSSNEKNNREKNSRNGEITAKNEDMKNKFTCVKFQDLAFVNTMTAKYSVNYLVFVTQFEILGDYSNPYKVGDNSYQNAIKTHYAIFKSDGSFVTGDYVTTNYPAKQTSPSIVCSKYLPEIANQIAKKIK